MKGITFEFTVPVNPAIAYEAWTTEEGCRLRGNRVVETGTGVF